MRTNSWLRTILTFVLLVGMYLPMATISQASSGSSAPIFDTTVTSTRFVDVVVGDNHTCGLRANGTVMCWGYNGEGQLGINDSFTRYSLYPVEVPNVTDAVAIAGASNITCILRRDSSMACWGYGSHGDGQGIVVKWGATTVPGLRDVVQMAVSNIGTCIINKIGYLVCWGVNYTNSEPQWVYTSNWES